MDKQRDSQVERDNLIERDSHQAEDNHQVGMEKHQVEKDKRQVGRDKHQVEDNHLQKDKRQVERGMQMDNQMDIRPVVEKGNRVEDIQHQGDNHIQVGMDIRVERKGSHPVVVDIQVEVN